MAISLNAGSEGSVFTGTTLTVDTTVGDLVIVQIRSNSNVFVTAVSDDVGTVYRRAIQIQNLAIWYGIAGGTDATNTITPTWASAVGSQGILSAAFTSTIGWATNPLHALDAAIDFNLTGPGMTTTIADALILGCGQRDGTGSAWSAGSGFTEAVEDSSNVQAMEYQVVSAIQSDVAFAITNAGTPADVIFLAFVEDQGGGGGGDVMGARIFTGY